MNFASREKGFSLVELVTVIILIGILAAYAAPRMDSTSFKLEASTGELLEVIRYAQEASMASVDYQYQVVTGGSDRYRVKRYDVDGAAASELASLLSGSSPFTADSGEWSDVSVGAASLSFDNRGYPCNSTAPCTSPMTAALSITVSISGDTRTITVEPITGFAHAN